MNIIKKLLKGNSKYFFLYNTGIYAFLQSISNQILDKVDRFGNSVINELPSSVQDLLPFNFSQIITLLRDTPLSWLIVSSLLVIISQIVTGALRFILRLIIIIFGLYLVWFFFTAL